MILKQDRLKELLCYDSETGLFERRMTSGGQAPGSPAGSIQKNGRLVIRIDGKRYLAHRLAWLYVYGSFPEMDIDHINGNPTDNRICNLRDVQSRVNIENQRSPKNNNKSGFLGVYWHKNAKKWAALIKSKGKKHYLGYFDTAEIAHSAYLSAKRQMHAGCTI